MPSSHQLLRKKKARIYQEDLSIKQPQITKNIVGHSKAYAFIQVKISAFSHAFTKLYIGACIYVLT
jgi:hypothetical protein